MHDKGKLQFVEGVDELLQHIKIRLCARRERFYPDPGFGSYLYRLKGQTGEKSNRLAMEYVMQALDNMPGVWPEQVVWDGNKAHVKLWVQNQYKDVTVEI